MEPTTSRTTQVIYLIIALAIIVGFVYIGMKHQDVTPVEDGTPTTVVPITWASAQVDQKVIEEKGDHYAINVAYPVAANSAVTDYFKSFADEQVKAFKDESIPIDLPADSATQVYTLDVTYRNERAAHADNYIFMIAIDTGGAHGLQATKAFSFTQEGKLIALKDLFTTGVSGLTMIAPYVKAQLAGQEMTTKDWIEDGAAPTELNYQNYVVTDTGIRFIFDAYQVAAYAAGIVTVDVPTSEFKSIANKDIFQ